MVIALVLVVAARPIESTVTLVSVLRFGKLELAGLKFTRDVASAKEGCLITSMPDVRCTVCLRLSPHEVSYHVTSLPLFSDPIFESGWLLIYTSAVKKSSKN